MNAAVELVGVDREAVPRAEEVAHLEVDAAEAAVLNELPDILQGRHASPPSWLPECGGGCAPARTSMLLASELRETCVKRG